MILMGVEYVVFFSRQNCCLLKYISNTISNSSQKKLEVVQVAAAAAEAVQALLLGLQ